MAPRKKKAAPRKKVAKKKASAKKKAGTALVSRKATDFQELTKVTEARMLDQLSKSPALAIAQDLAVDLDRDPERGAHYKFDLVKYCSALVMGLSYKAAAACTGCTPQYCSDLRKIRPEYQAVVELAAAEGHAQLEMLVRERAMISDTMLIWLTKNTLGWSDKRELAATHDLRVHPSMLEASPDAEPDAKPIDQLTAADF